MSLMPLVLRAAPPDQALRYYIWLSRRRPAVLTPLAMRSRMIELSMPLPSTMGPRRCR